jgi:hypothetical protein
VTSQADFLTASKTAESMFSDAQGIVDEDLNALWVLSSGLLSRKMSQQQRAIDLPRSRLTDSIAKSEDRHKEKMTTASTCNNVVAG